MGCVQSGSAPIGLIEALDGNDDRRITVEGKINRLIGQLQSNAYMSKHFIVLEY